MPGLAPRATAWACRRRALLKLAPPFSFLYVAIQQSGSSYPLSLLKRASSGVVLMLSASFMTSSMVRLARCKISVSAQLIGWSFAHACSAMADLYILRDTSPMCCFVQLLYVAFRACIHALHVAQTYSVRGSQTLLVNTCILCCRIHLVCKTMYNSVVYLTNCVEPPTKGQPPNKGQ